MPVLRDTHRQRQTQSHYDTFPYEVGVRQSLVYESPHTLMGRFITEIKGGSILDIGCGPGNLLAPLAQRGNRVWGLDLSWQTLHLAVEHLHQSGQGSKVQLVQGSALVLPFASGQFDRVFAVGSLHHTPNARAGFSELCRVLNAEGRAYIALYRKHSYYHVLYQTLGKIARLCEKNRLLALIINRLLILPLFLIYFVLGRWIIHRRLQIPRWQESLNYFADQLLNPVVSFHTSAEIESWAHQTGMKISEIATAHAGALLNIVICRP
ncbi:Demethylrebeccamycin-D-glucose O-methyltransferase [Anaerolineae bacterium]|nr:Demethylrebeccamycin-D-glucose O-methyltransferase [Anaerolineae bacterium]